MRGAIKGIEGKVKLTRVPGADGQNGIVTLLPDRQISLMVDKNLGAVVQPMAVAGEGVDQEIRPLLPPDVEALAQDGKEKIFKLRGAVGKVQGDFPHGFES
jgi:hypothetical protein